MVKREYLHNGLILYKSNMSETHTQEMCKTIKCFKILKISLKKKESTLSDLAPCVMTLVILNLPSINHHRRHSLPFVPYLEQQDSRHQSASILADPKPRQTKIYLSLLSDWWFWWEWRGWDSEDQCGLSLFVQSNNLLINC